MQQRRGVSLAGLSAIDERRIWPVGHWRGRSTCASRLKAAFTIRTGGSQYCAHDDHKRLKRHGFKASMRGKGHCYDNAMAETFFKTLKAKLSWRQAWHTQRQCELALFQSINGAYNPRRRHSALGYKSPVTFERKAA